jgi:hypothetical protein
MSFYKNILPGKSVSESAPTTTSISTVKNLRVGYPLKSICNLLKKFSTEKAAGTLDARIRR